MTTTKKCVLLLSGGLDSSTVLAMVRHAKYAVYAMTFDYGQKQVVELQAAQRMATRYGCEAFRVAHIDLAVFAHSALTTQTTAVPKDGPIDATHIPITYVPARNTIFLSYALAWAETLGIFDIFIGANQVDYSGYPDCRPAFIEAFTHLANLATRAAVEQRGQFVIHAPLMHMRKDAIIKQGLSLGVDYSQTHSCYDPINGLACGHCESCNLRKQAFLRAGIADPTLYGAEHA